MMSDMSEQGVSHGGRQQLDAETERELAQALEGQGADELMEASTAPAAKSEAASGEEEGAAQGQKQSAPQHFEYELKRGRIAAVRGDDVFVELTGIDGKNQGVVPLTQFERPPRPGSIMDFVVERYDEAEGLIILSREGAVTRATWEQLQRGAIVDARAVAANKGGLEMEMVGGIRAFMPASQVDMTHVDDLEPLVGQKLQAMVLEIDRKSKKVLLSRRKLLEYQRQAQEQKVWESLEVGQTREGKIRSIVDFGAFVDLGGVDGLLHISDMSYTRVKKPTDVVKVGDLVSVKVIKLDKEAKRISLGLKQVTPDPWDGLTTRYTVGEQVSGRVLRIADFGAFVEVEPGVEGLLPIGEMSWRRIHNPNELVKEGDVVKVSVLAVDGEKRRLTLSLKQTQGDPWKQVSEKYPRHGLVEATVVRLADFGAFVELEPGIEALVHISELADRRVASVEEVLKVGDRKEFRILEVDEENHRVRASLKAVKEAPPAPTPAQMLATKPRKAAARSGRPLKGGIE